VHELRAVRVELVELADGTRISLPALFVNGAAAGPRLYLGAAIHGDEVNGVAIVARVLAQLDPARLAGSIVAVLVQNPLAFPNPFNDERGTVFSFYLETDRPSKVLLRVYAISGRMIYERVTDVAAAGYQQLAWNGLDAEGRALANGVYFYRLTAENGGSTSRYEGRLVKLRKPTHISDEQSP